jgi:phage-related protein (TIGR01555 family)
LCWGRLYGGAVGLILIKGQEDLSKPLDMDTIMPGSFLGIRILDRWSGVFPQGDLVTDPEDPDFGLPDYYTIRDVRDTFEINVHHSRVIRFIGRELPWLEQVAELYWGESEIEAIYNEIVRRDNVAANITALTYKAQIEYREVEGLDQLLGIGNTEMQRRFWNQMQAMSIVRSSQGISLINKGDSVHNESYTFTGLGEVYDRIMMDVAGAARTPVTKLFGRSPAGMNSTGESDLANYYDYIDGLRETSLRAILDKLVPIMALSCWGKLPDDLEIIFPSMQSPDEKAIAETGAIKANTVIAAYQNDLIDKETADKELIDIEGMFDKITDEQAEEGRGVTYSGTRMMNDPMAGIV